MIKPFKLTSILSILFLLGACSSEPKPEEDQGQVILEGGMLGTGHSVLDSGTTQAFDQLDQSIEGSTQWEQYKAPSASTFTTKATDTFITGYVGNIFISQDETKWSWTESYFLDGTDPEDSTISYDNELSQMDAREGKNLLIIEDKDFTLFTCTDGTLPNTSTTYNKILDKKGYTRIYKMEASKNTHWQSLKVGGSGNWGVGLPARNLEYLAVNQTETTFSYFFVGPKMNGLNEIQGKYTIIGYQSIDNAIESAYSFEKK